MRHGERPARPQQPVPPPPENVSTRNHVASYPHKRKRHQQENDHLGALPKPIHAVPLLWLVRRSYGEIMIPHDTSLDRCLLATARPETIDCPFRVDQQEISVLALIRALQNECYDFFGRQRRVDRKELGREVGCVWGCPKRAILLTWKRCTVFDIISQVLQASSCCSFSGDAFLLMP